MSQPDPEIVVTVQDIDKAPNTLPAPQLNYFDQYHNLMGSFSKVSEEKFALLEENARLKSHNATRQHLDDLIKPFARRIFWFMCVYSLAVGSILFLCGFGYAGFRLEGTTQNYLVGSTGVSVFSLVGTVLLGIFRSTK